MFFISDLKLFCIILFLKDIPFKNGIGKKIYKINIISRKTKKEATLFQLLFRNITLIIFPIEIIVLIFSHNDMRLGDRLAGTMVIAQQKL